MVPVVTIVVIAKAPVAGQCKTRLVPAFGADGSAQFARAMLLDVLTSLSECAPLQSTEKILVYAPPTDTARDMMQSLLDEHITNSQDWILTSVAASNTTSLLSSHLTTILQDAFHFALQGRQTNNVTTTTTTTTTSTSTNNSNRNNNNHHPGHVIFLGMDCPEVPLEELVYIVSNNDDSCELSHQALLCPAADGGYGLLAIPRSAPIQKIFHGVLWSHPLTALSQLKALSDCRIPTIIGPLMHDMDTIQDVEALCERIRPGASQISTPTISDGIEHSCLTNSSTWAIQGSKQESERSFKMPHMCRFTKQILQELGKL